MGRTAVVERNTSETKIRISLDLDGKGNARIDTGIGFFDHMLTSFAKHSLIDLEVKTEGDLRVDGHHSVEDTGIVLGSAIKEALGEKQGIRRYGSMMLPMDDALVMCTVDLCGRPWFAYDLNFTMPRIGELDSELIKEFFYAVSYSAAINLHLKQMDGSNNHHIAEAAFKAFARALREAVSLDPRVEGTPSTKGCI